MERKTRITTGPLTASISCTQLPAREGLMSRLGMLSCKGGGGKGGKTGGKRTPDIQDAVNLTSYNPDDGGVTRQRAQLEAGSILMGASVRDTANANRNIRVAKSVISTISTAWSDLQKMRHDPASCDLCKNARGEN